MGAGAGAGAGVGVGGARNAQSVPRNRSGLGLEAPWALSMIKENRSPVLEPALPPAADSPTAQRNSGPGRYILGRTSSAAQGGGQHAVPAEQGGGGQRGCPRCTLLPPGRPCRAEGLPVSEEGVESVLYWGQ